MGDSDGQASVYDSGSGGLLLQIVGASRVSLSPDGNTLLSFGGSGIVQRRIPDGDIVRQMQAPGYLRAERIGLGPDRWYTGVGHG